MKKNRLVSLLSFLFLFCCGLNKVNAEIVKWITPKPVFYLVNGITLENGNDVVPQTTLLDMSLTADMDQLKLMAGGQFQLSIMDFTTSAIYAPTFFNHFNFGGKAVIHCKYYHDLFFENDLLTGLYFRYFTGNHFAIAADFMYHHKAAHIYEIKDDVFWLCNHNVAFNVEFEYKPFKKLLFDFSISSYSTYRFMNFFAPDFKFLSEYKVSKILYAGFIAEIQYVDMFTLSSNLNTIDFGLYAKLEL